MPSSIPRRLWDTHVSALLLIAVSIGAAVGVTGQDTRTVSMRCTGGFRGYETGYLVAVMPPDVPFPEGGLSQPGLAENGLVLGDTVGRTPGAFGFIVSCHTQGYLAPDDVVVSASLSLYVSDVNNINPLSDAWAVPDMEPGPAILVVDMVRHVR